jgi:hypothetical protein
VRGNKGSSARGPLLRITPPRCSAAMERLAAMRSERTRGRYARAEHGSTSLEASDDGSEMDVEMPPDHETRFELAVPAGGRPGARIVVDLPSGLRIRVQLPPGAVPEAVVSFGLPAEVDETLDDQDRQALARSEFVVRTDIDEDGEALSPGEAVGGGTGGGTRDTTDNPLLPREASFFPPTTRS